MTNVGLYPGCSLEGSSREYGESLHAIASHIGLELTELERWECCGASSAHALDHQLALVLPARVLAQAEEQKLNDLLVPCAACYNRLASTQAALAQDAALRASVVGTIGMDYAGSGKIHNILDMLRPLLTKDVVAKFAATFPYKVVCYYGCLLVRPPKVLNASRVEDPDAMDEIMKRIGATPLAWGMKTECCGAGLSISRTDIVGELGGRILEDAAARGAEAIIVACPMCHSNLDMRRPQIEKTMGKKYSIPVIYITQAIGLALGLDPHVLGLQRHFVPVLLRGKSKQAVVTEAVPA